MGAPYRLLIGYGHDHETITDLPEEMPLEDSDGGSALNAFEVADRLNQNYRLSIVLPWMGDYRPVRDETGRWYVEYRETIYHEFSNETQARNHEARERPGYQWPGP